MASHRPALVGCTCNRDAVTEAEGDRRALSGHRHRRHRPVRVRRDAGRRGPVGPGVPDPGRGQGELTGSVRSIALSTVHCPLSTEIRERSRRSGRGDRAVLAPAGGGAGGGADSGAVTAVIENSHRHRGSLDFSATPSKPHLVKGRPGAAAVDRPTGQVGDRLTSRGRRSSTIRQGKSSPNGARPKCA
jgi:hypothetical protein